ncbi:hypothetical protein, variant [Capsaspora owczarzaki ATCC 30864]|nr:hypothetical protein, variant [Capsaspora owczarzaki ATCC 30864]
MGGMAPEVLPLKLRWLTIDQVRMSSAGMLIKPPATFGEHSLPHAIDNCEVTSADDCVPSTSVLCRAQHRYYSNITNRLLSREISSPVLMSTWRSQRAYAQCIYPNTTFYDVKVPLSQMTLFSPDGNYLITFGISTPTLRVYKLVRPTLLDEEILTDASTARDRLFEDFFSPHFELSFAHEGSWLHKDIALFANQGRHLIVATASETPRPAAIDIDAALVPCSLENITLHVVELATGALLDQRRFLKEVPNWGHTHIHLQDDLLSVLSLREQTITIFKVKRSGELAELVCFGQQCFPDDEQEIQRIHRAAAAYQASIPTARVTVPSFSSGTVVSAATTRPSSIPRWRGQNLSLHGGPSAFTSGIQPSSLLAAASQLTVAARLREDSGALPSGSPPYTGIRQRFLSFMMRRAAASADPVKALRRFYFRFDKLASALMIEAQLLDPAHVLICFSSHLPIVNNALQLRTLIPELTHEVGQESVHFVIYNHVTAEIIAGFESDSESLGTMFTLFYEQFCSHPEVGNANWMDGPCSSLYWREQYRRQLAFLPKGNVWARRLLYQRWLLNLPLTAQIHNSSPYLDASLFAFEENAISSISKNYRCVENPIPFFSRATGALKFHISTNVPGPAAAEPRYQTQTFHPYLPFGITTRFMTLHAPVTNFHFRTQDKE